MKMRNFALISMLFPFAARSCGQPRQEVFSAGDRVEIAVAGVEFAYRWCPAGEFKMGGRWGCL